MRKNVLITSCGAKVALIRAFRSAARVRGGRVLVSDLSPLAPARFEADATVELPAWDDAGYANALIAACERHRIGLLVPTADRELPYLAPVADALRASGAAVLMPAPSALQICRDKLAFARWCGRHGLSVPRTYAANESPDCFPVFVRPVVGQGGNRGQRVESADLLAAIRAHDADWLVQDYCTDPEYSVDLLMDLAGEKALQAVARRRLQVYGGEAQVSRVERVDELTGSVMRLGEMLGLVGHNVVQAFHTVHGGTRFVEVNPRFGGASTLSICAGLDSPARLLDLLAGDERARQPRDIRFGLTMLRYAEDRYLQTDDAT